MKALYLIFLLLLTVCVSRSVGVAAEQQPSAHKPCVDHLNAVPASEEDTATFNQILHSVPSDRTILLYVSHDQIIRNYGGAMSLHCEVASQEIYDTYEDWTVYDPDLIQGDAARDFVFAHEIAHHMNGDTTSAMRNSVDVELRADLDGARYLQRLGWSEARLMHALDLLNLPQSQQKGYPTSNRRRENIREAFAPPQIGAPTGLTGRAVAENPSLAERIDNLLQYGGPLRFESARTGKLVCAIGTADRRIPTLENFEFFDNCEDSKFTRFQLLRNADKSQLWITQQADPCPDYAVNCLYVLK